MFKKLVKTILILFSIIFRESDISMTISYRFNQTTEPLPKKRKITDTKTKTILEYSSIKLPASKFIHYLTQDLAFFNDQCLR